MAAGPITQFITYLTRKSTSKQSYFYHILPDFRTVLSLAMIAAVIVASTVFLSGIAAILPVMAVTALTAFSNFWFSREIQTAMLGLTYTSDDSGDTLYEVGLSNAHGEAVLYDLAKVVNHLRGVINAKYPRDTPLPPVRLGTFVEAHHKLVVTGRNPGKAMIAIATGTFSHLDGNVLVLNALILQALAQIKLRSTFSGMIVAIAMDFGQLLKSFKEHEFLPLKLIGLLVGPFGQLLINAMSRTNAYYQADKIVAECGYGQDLIDALSYLNAPNNKGKVPPAAAPEANLPDSVYTGPFAFLKRAWHNFEKKVREDSPPAEDKTGYVLLQAMDNAVMRFAAYFKELYSAVPRMGNRLAAIRAYMAENAPVRQMPADQDCYNLCDRVYVESLTAGHAHGAHAHAPEDADLPDLVPVGPQPLLFLAAPAPVVAPEPKPVRRSARLEAKRYRPTYR